MNQSLNALLEKISRCRECEPALPFGARPVLAAGRRARISVIGQAPGRRVHASGVPWDDASGSRLRDWMGINASDFYDPNKVAIVPMGFCYPGTGKSGDLPPRAECAPLWHEDVLSHLPSIDLTLLLSAHAHAYYLGKRRKDTLTQTVRAFKDYTPRLIPLPHPSPRNNIWLRKNPWFEQEVLPYLRRRVRASLREGDRNKSLRSGPPRKK